MKWIVENWQTLGLVLGGLGTLWNFLSEKRKAILSAPFTKKKEKIELNKDELSFIEQLQEFQKKQLQDLINENMKLQEDVRTLRERIIELENRLNNV